MRKNLIILALFTVILNLFLFRHVGSLGLSLFVGTTTLVVFLLSLKKSSKKIRLYTAVLGVTETILLLFTLLRASEFVVVVARLGALLLSFLIIYTIKTEQIYLKGLSELISVPLRVGIGYLRTSFSNIMMLLHGHFTKLLGIEDESFRFGQLPMIVTGIVLGIPVVWLILSLLLSADPIFAKSMEQILTMFSIDRIVKRIVFSCIGIVVILPFIRLIVPRRPGLSLSLFEKPHTVPVMATIVSMVGLLLLLFLTIQWQYIFVRVAHEMDLSKYGAATYSEYTKKGFGELIIVTGIVYVLLWISHVVGRKLELKKRIGLVAIQTFVTMELFVFMLSVLRRVRLYWNFHGLSLIRIYGAALVIFLGIFTFTLMLRYFTKRVRFVTIELITIIVFIVGLGMWNEETYIVKHHPPTVNGNVDYVYLARLSSDGYEGWKEAFSYASQTIQKYQGYSSLMLTPQVRKELSYSGMIVSVLSRRYHEYVTQYANASEQRSYYDAILMNQKKLVSNLTPLLKQDFETIRHKGSNTIGLLDGLFIPINNYMTNKYEIRSQNIPKVLSDIAKTNKRIEEDAKSIHEKGYPAKPIALTPFTPLTTYQYQYCHRVYRFMGSYEQTCIPSFYTILLDSISPYTPWNQLDRFLSWNISEYQAYERLKKDIPFVKLMTIQNQYIDLYYRIVALPENERTVEWDISLNAPFISSLY